MKNKFFLIAFFSAAVFAGCKSTTQVIYNDGVPGSIIGQVALMDSVNSHNAGQRQLGDASGVLVSIEGTSYAATTDRSGKFTLENVPPGTYWLLYTKDGFETSRQGPQTFAGNGTLLLNAALNRQTHKTPELVLRPFDTTG